MISCYPQHNEHMLTSRQLREKTQNIMNQIPAFQDRLQDELDNLLDEIRKCAANLDNSKIEKLQRTLMMDQLSCMAAYAAVLATRLENLEYHD